MSCRLLYSTFPNIDISDFLSALGEMKHGGPDAPGCYSTYGTVMLGHNRLSILDLNPRSNQPFMSKDGRYAIIYNGEVYNYRELAKNYGINTLTDCDTEVILELSIMLGFEKALEQLNGMFAYIIYDTLSGDFFVARDRLGVKPLYMYTDGKNYIFSSEINAVISLLFIVGKKVEIDDIGLRQYKRLRSFYNGKTIYKGIEIFPAAHYMKKGQICKWWSLPFNEQEVPSDEELYYLIDSAIDYRMISDVPLGVYLSGGLDSTVVAVLAAKKYKNILHSWIAGICNDEKFNEFSYGLIASQYIGTTHHEIYVDKDDFLETAKYMIKVRKEPLSVPNEVLLYKMSIAVKKKNTVVLCGEGADELFFGYDRIYRGAQICDSFDLFNFSQNYTFGAMNNDLEILESVIEPFYEYGPKPIDIIAAFMQTNRLQELLRRLDNSSMMCAVETRVPFCDYRLVERLYKVPFDWKMKDGIVKAPLKRIFKHEVPNQIVERHKIGFSVSLSDIFNVSQEQAFDAWTNFNISQLYNYNIEGAFGCK
jgi:asparagine synthase (glutamine-hydrolysing)